MEYIGKEIREKRNMSQVELSRKSGVSRSIICGLETGRTKTTTTATLQKIAETLEVPINDLFSRASA